MSSFQQWIGLDSFFGSTDAPLDSEETQSDSKTGKGNQQDDKKVQQQDLQDLNTLATLRCWTAIEECAANVASIYHTTSTPAGNIPLHTAISNGAPLTTVQALIVANPLSVAYQNNFGNTPLHFAAWKNKHPDSFLIVEFLLHFYPQSARIANKHGNLPLHNATNYKANSDIVQILYRAYPQGVAAKNDKGKTPLDHAIHRLGEKHPTVALLQGATARNYVYNHFASESSRKKPTQSVPYHGGLISQIEEKGVPKITVDVWDDINLE